MPPRLKTHIRIAAHIRRAQMGGAFAAVVRRGDEDAGAVAVKVFAAGKAQVFTESRNDAGEPIWRDPLDGFVAEAEADAWLAKEIEFDQDLWILEIDDREGRGFLD